MMKSSLNFFRNKNPNFLVKSSMMYFWRALSLVTMRDTPLEKSVAKFYAS